MAKPQKRKRKRIVGPFKAFVANSIKAFGLIITFCGVPGICVFLLSLFIIKQVSHERKQELLDAVMYIIKSDKATLLFIYFIIGFFAILYVYNTYWTGREKILKKRMKKLQSVINTETSNET